MCARMKPTILLTAAILIAHSPFSKAAVIYVATDGDDADSGLCYEDEGNGCGPKLTIQGAVDIAVESVEGVVPVVGRQRASTPDGRQQRFHSSPLIW